MNKFLLGLGAMVAAFGIIAVFIFILAYPAMLLWNALIPELFNGPFLSFWQTFGLIILFRIFLPSTSKTKTKSED
jgi:uncharacterized RDD family membrane protein YckC